MCLPAYLSETIVEKKFPPIQMLSSFISRIFREPFFKSKNMEGTAGISGNK